MPKSEKKMQQTELRLTAWQSQDNTSVWQQEYVLYDENMFCLLVLSLYL